MIGLVRSLSQYTSFFSSQDWSQWATPREKERYESFSCPKRKQEWLLGRLTAKELVQEHWARVHDRKLFFPEIEILNEEGGKPFFRILGERVFSFSRLPDLSISHSNGLAFCALQDREEQSFGVDLEYIAPRPSLFLETFYDEAERERLGGEGKEYWKSVTAVWSLKESALKALGHGLRMDTAKIRVFLRPLSASWQPQRVLIDDPDVEGVEAWARCLGSYVFSWVEIEKKSTRTIGVA